jgi:WD40 repeat protein
MLVSSGDDDTVRIWNVESGEELYRLQLEYTAYRVDWSPDGANIAIRSADLLIWDMFSVMD